MLNLILLIIRLKAMINQMIAKALSIISYIYIFP